MDIGIGVDCEEISRFKEVGLERSFLDRILTAKELGYCSSKKDPFPHIAARFVGKEAIIKAFNNFNKQVSFGEIEILNDDNGLPRAKVMSKGMNGFDIKISLSHSKNNAVAFALVIHG